MARRERTLLASLLLSMWAPLATGIAVVLSRSTTQLADFVRRSVELTALFVSWMVFRHINRDPDMTPDRERKLESTAGAFVAVALCVSGSVMAGLALYRVRGFDPGGNAVPGLIVAILGTVTNSWFWRRYTGLVREQYNAILETQRRLYRAKTFVDLCVTAALGSVVLAPLHPATRYVDVLGSLVVAGYLVWSGVGTARQITLDRDLDALSPD